MANQNVRNAKHQKVANETRKLPRPAGRGKRSLYYNVKTRTWHQPRKCGGCSCGAIAWCGYQN